MRRAKFARALAKRVNVARLLNFSTAFLFISDRVASSEPTQTLPEQQRTSIKFAASEYRKVLCLALAQVVLVDQRGFGQSDRPRSLGLTGRPPRTGRFSERRAQAFCWSAEDAGAAPGREHCAADQLESSGRCQLHCCSSLDDEVCSFVPPHHSVMTGSRQKQS